MIDIPTIGFGTWPLRGKEVASALSAAFETGFRHIDTAQIYGNERDVGEAMQRSGLGRDEIFLTTKVSPDNLSASRFLPSVEQSLDELEVNQVDLLLIHWPPRDRSQFDSAIDILIECRETGRARHVGVSNFTPKMLDRAVARSPAPLVTNQVEYHPLIDQRPLEEAARRHDMKLTAYAALARGECLREPAIAGTALKHGVSPAEVVLSWILHQGVNVLTRSANPGHIRSSWRSQKLKLSRDEIEDISALRKANRRIVTPAGLLPGWDF